MIYLVTNFSQGHSSGSYSSVFRMLALFGVAGDFLFSLQLVFSISLTILCHVFLYVMLIYIEKFWWLTLIGKASAFSYSARNISIYTLHTISHFSVKDFEEPVVSSNAAVGIPSCEPRIKEFSIPLEVRSRADAVHMDLYSESSDKLLKM